KRMSTSDDVPKLCTSASAWPASATRARTSASSTAPSNLRPASTPPVNSRPQLNPRVTIATREITTSSTESPTAGFRCPMKSKLGARLSSCTGHPAADGQTPQLRASAVDEVDDRSGHDDAGEHRRHDTETQRDREALDRTRAEREEHDARDQRRDLAVRDTREGLLVSGPDARLRRVAVPKLLTDTLVDQHVRVDRHAERQHDAGDAGQRQRGLQQRHQ